MKKIIFYVLTTVFVFAIGLAYAEENGVTDFKGLTYDSGPAGIPDTTMEGVNAGGMREEGAAAIWDNGVTDFKGKTVEEKDISIEPSPLSIEGANAGGMREEGLDPSNGVTVFHGFDSN